MTSLSDAYEKGMRTVVDRRRRVLAVSLFALGAAMCAVAILLTTTGVRSWVGFDVTGARRVGGVLAGLGLPAAMIGIFAALPASDETRAAAAIGASVAVFGVLLFVSLYPSRWLSSDSASPALAVATVGLYALGTLVVFWCLFVAVATFNRRNDPGGTARVEVTDEGTVRLISRDSATDPASDETPSAPGIGGIGVVGTDPGTDLPTQTNSTDGPGSPQTGDATSATTKTATRAGADTTGRSGSSQTTPERTVRGPEPTSDGGQSVQGDRSATVLGEADSRPDTYCGNCAHFAYVEAAGDLDPYCGYHEEFMEDLDACDNWVPNTGDNPRR
jgi:hypothetical protein